MVKCIVVDKSIGEYVRRILYRNNVVDKRYRISVSKDKLCIPVIDIAKASEILGREGIVYSVDECILEPRKAVKRFEKIPAHDVIGRVAIVRDNVLEYMSREEVVEAIRSVYPRVQCIYLKKGTESDYRVSRLELLWGKDVGETIHREYGISFYILLHRVYYNPRLSTEHHLIASEVGNGEFIVDAFSGIGGFTLHIACSKRAIVLANDINPWAIECLLKSIELNRKRIKSSIIVSQNDAWRLMDIVCRGCVDRIIANLPHKSLEFRELYSYLSHRDTILYIYTIASSSREAIDKTLEVMREWSLLGVRKVLDYSPYRYVFRVKLTRL